MFYITNAIYGILFYEVYKKSSNCSDVVASQSPQEGSSPTFPPVLLPALSPV